MSGAWVDLLLLSALAAAVWMYLRMRQPHPLEMVTGPAGGGTIAAGQRRWYRALTLQAGFDPDRSAWFYWFAKIALGVGLPLLFGELVGQRGRQPEISVLVVLAAAGFFLPDGWLAFLRRRRRNRILKALSFFLDLLVALLHAGLNIEQALRRAATHGLEPRHPLARDVRLALSELDAGRSRDDAFHALAERAGVAELRALAAALRLAARHGTSIETALATQAELLRVKRRENLRRQIAVAATKTIVPVFLCGFPVFIVIVFFPTIFELLETTRALFSNLR